MSDSELLDLLQSLSQIDAAIYNILADRLPDTNQFIALKRAQNAIDLAKAQVVTAMPSIQIVRGE